MFALITGFLEDHVCRVCDTAHTLSMLDWMALATRELSGVVNAMQVSSSGGDIKIQFDVGEKRIELAGKPEVRPLARSSSSGIHYVINSASGSNLKRSNH